jgi:hypothetical protein
MELTVLVTEKEVKIKEEILLLLQGVGGGGGARTPVHTI